MKQDELDGLIYFPTRDSNESIAIIIEAKNYYNGENGAERQLRSTEGFLSTELDKRIKQLSKVAYMELSFKA